MIYLHPFPPSLSFYSLFKCKFGSYQAQACSINDKYKQLYFRVRGGRKKRKRKLRAFGAIKTSKFLLIFLT